MNSITWCRFSQELLNGRTPLERAFALFQHERDNYIWDMGTLLHHICGDVSFPNSPI